MDECATGRNDTCVEQGREDIGRVLQTYLREQIVRGRDANVVGVPVDSQRLPIPASLLRDSRFRTQAQGCRVWNSGLRVEDPTWRQSPHKNTTPMPELGQRLNTGSLEIKDTHRRRTLR